MTFAVIANLPTKSCNRLSDAQFVQGDGGICSHHAMWIEDVLGDAKAFNCQCGNEWFENKSFHML